MPDDNFLLRMGKMAFMVTAIEGLPIFDLPGPASHLP